MPEDIRGRLASAGVEVHADASGLHLLERARAVVKSPGVPAQAPVVASARARGIPVLGELELAWRLLDAPWVAVTGTNGKTTSVELLGHVFRAAGAPAVVAGNVGTPVSSLVGALAPGSTILCEASSFQLEDTLEFRPDVGVLLNVSEDHLDRHGTLAEYTRAKLEVFARQGPGDVAVAPCDFDVALPGQGRRACFGTAPDAALCDDGTALRWEGARVVGVDELALRGAHNRENAMAAAAAALARGLAPEAVARGLRTFPGVAHRLEEVSRRDGILWVNDSKATNPASTRVALDAFDRPVHLILGGRGKGGGYDALREPVAARCAAVYLVGEAAPALADVLRDAGPPLRDCGDLETAVDRAAASARPGDVVLLSPACASYDQYADFEARGAHFRALARGEG